jgi:hypothetical protein
MKSEETMIKREDPVLATPGLEPCPPSVYWAGRALAVRTVNPTRPCCQHYRAGYYGVRVIRAAKVAALAKLRCLLAPIVGATPTTDSSFLDAKLILGFVQTAPLPDCPYAWVTLNSLGKNKRAAAAALFLAKQKCLQGNLLNTRGQFGSGYYLPAKVVGIFQSVILPQTVNRIRLQVSKSPLGFILAQG